MFFVMTVVAVRSMDQRARHLHDAVEVDEEECANGKDSGRRQATGCGAAEMFKILITSKGKEQLADG